MIFAISKESYLSTEEARRYLGTGALVCGGELSTVNYLGKSVFAGTSHGIVNLNLRKQIGYEIFKIPYDASRIKTDRKYRIEIDALLQRRKRDVRANNVLFEQAIAATFRKIAPTCKIYLTDRDGNIFGPPLRLVTYKNESYNIDRSSKEKDRLRITVDRFPDPKLEPPAVSLVPTSKAAIMNRNVVIYAYHADMNSNRKFKSVGFIRPLKAENEIAGLPNIVGHDVDTIGWASGAFLYDLQGRAVCMHLGSTTPNQDKLSYDGNDRSNYCMVIDASFISYMSPL